VHEFSLAQGLVDQLLQLAGQHRAKKIITVRLDIGSQSGIVVDSFSFGFEVLTRGNPLLRNAVLAITEIQPSWHCPDCGGNGVSANLPAACGHCGSHGPARTGGDELILTQVEME
jgi:hydrogenase nickel incorporation protein HypA/HybF